MKLIEKSDKLMSYSNLDQVACEEFINELTFSNLEEIVELLIHVRENYEFEFPLWARMLSYRLALLQEPENQKVLELAGIGILTFGDPYYNDLANECINRAKEIKEKNKAQ
jgi:hypothetical protein